ncbi:hypothetical protein KAFR_0G02730 [Kazachstania africana CBS 2517]|uniref:Flo11 domain-containing protein n=1 Tax=Kazachstania africana (strain ATCC 22294 / BCRC 22015 / CBS 2517 / CECT 1963 / NBRC 1671 / NRRL Y-8276) TaxID=1071382 RepID=H2AY54_KAZAF|nr:hypothetical protein KAFR_0G02730 [Kazachstania africana CBS 2517]CCF59304.1 hypothetical protein KAFR_0G02730 [Kazachstania africana CBS 2517]
MIKKISRLLLFLLLYSFRTIQGSSILQQRGPQQCQEITNGCPSLNFDFHAQNIGSIQYNLDILSVWWVSDSTYNMTIHATGAEQIPLKYLYSLKIIGVDGPESTVQLYGKNENTYLIDNPTDFTATFAVYASADDDGKVWMPNFQIQFEYLQGDAAQYWESWEWGSSTFDLMTGCDNYDNNGNSQTDFPDFYWVGECADAAASSFVASSTSTLASTTVESSQSSLNPTGRLGFGKSISSLLSDVPSTAGSRSSTAFISSSSVNSGSIATLTRSTTQTSQSFLN